MIIKATQKNTRQTALKVRLVANAVKGMKLEDAIKQLGVIERKSSIVVLKVIRQAIANAMNNHGLTFDDLTLKNIVVTGGPSYKRFRAVSRGRAHSIIKRTCHVSVELESGVVPKEAAPVKKAKNAAKVEKTETVEEKKVATKTAKKPVATKKVSKKK
ncbi:MAG: 50S ribosomal protein L22 [Candidatus Pacebacteria bacterium]|nr:50S ribosomal protein L22 [Candidatus Paceibacterota bacterium]PIR64037.1 MAG: 50S ribosomal protein L22 [Candidatus Pacebacteria bacterium CG10_big_fil_rev_8_21_14_0_10_40_26]PIZ79659.1 MAG: 50S ribosomal protein L22 [Candidatus Pacebacteria bacterium CG_4_10_14_0_2_um_filter_40_20]PJA69113.1 MAG: 50S ribosomal protein L22 [Candidatus Pacebacteria bacterium CG_4_9_14_3_um_filter_40_12]PJC41754.1 MAG: 50S ribosomal protein L22 [Candidatus Pacebacteria bacterium CG_4_9_14_0_2_um_filter_40_15]